MTIEITLNVLPFTHKIAVVNTVIKFFFFPFTKLDACFT